MGVSSLMQPQLHDAFYAGFLEGQILSCEILDRRPGQNASLCFRALRHDLYVLADRVFEIHRTLPT